MSKLWNAHPDLPVSRIDNADCFPKDNALVLGLAEHSLRECVEVGKERGFDAFVVFKDIAYFRRQPLEECVEHIVGCQGATLYAIHRSSEPTNPMLVILSCQKNRDLWSSLLKREPSNCIVFAANADQEKPFSFKDRVLTVRCADTYEGLPEKICAMIRAVLAIPEFDSITHIVKIDDHDTVFDRSTLGRVQGVLAMYGRTLHYGGQHVNMMKSGNRTWHFGKCSETSPWNERRYPGAYTPWVDGGCGYVLSRTAMQMVAQAAPKTNEAVGTEHIYEDVMVALLLKKFEVSPTQIPPVIHGDKLKYFGCLG